MFFPMEVLGNGNVLHVKSSLKGMRSKILDKVVVGAVLFWTSSKCIVWILLKTLGYFLCIQVIPLILVRVTNMNSIQ